jgi:HAD superfamily hydrolase (TIGR01450 family)
VAVQFLTNNATRSPAAYRERLADMGIPASEGDVVTSGLVTADYLATDHPGETAYVVGEPALRAALGERGVTVTDDPGAAELVVLSLDTGIDYALLTDVLRAVRPDRPIVATNPDRTKPGADGVVPSAGCVIGAVEGMTGREPDHVAGKPSGTAARFALSRLGVDASDCLLVGDRLDTDVAMGNAAGMTTVLVRTGVTEERDLWESPHRPDHVLGSIGGIGAVLDAERVE